MAEDKFSENKLEGAAGNAMHLPSVGFSMLVAALCLEPFHP